MMENITNAIADADTNLLVGGGLFVLMIVSVLLGDEFWVPSSKKKTAGLANTAVIRPLMTMAFAAWLEVYCLSALISYNYKILLGWFGLACVFAVYDLKYRWLPDFEGIDITVRQPNNKKLSFAQGMDFSMDPNNLGTCSTILMFFWFAASAMIIIFEISIHVLMGLDEDRVDEDGKNLKTCEGMMAQELVPFSP